MSSLLRITFSDLEDIHALNQQIFKNQITYEKDYLKERCLNGDGFIVKVYDTTVGYLLYDGDVVMSIGVLSTYRRYGYARAMMQAVLRLDQITQLHVMTTNCGAIRLYRSLGFYVDRIEIGYYNSLNGEDAYLMKK